MNFIKTDIQGVYIIEPRIFQDERGYFFESYNENEFIKNGILNRFVQDNQSKSSYGVVRGLHWELFWMLRLMCDRVPIHLVNM